MKRHLLILLYFVSSVSANAQIEFKKFKIGVGVGYATGTDEQTNGGGLIYLEPAYRLTDAICIGLRIETFSANVGFPQFDGPSFGTLSMNGQYYFNNYNLRGFIGAGIGLFNLKGFSTGADAKSKIGFYPRIGFDFGNLNMYADYTIMPSSNSESGEIKNNYLGLHIGISIGGGRYKNARRR